MNILKEGEFSECDACRKDVLMLIRCLMGFQKSTVRRLNVEKAQGIENIGLTKQESC